MGQNLEEPIRLKVTHAIVGGGYQLRPGQVIERDELGDFAETLIRQGALEPCEETGHPHPTS